MKFRLEKKNSEKFLILIADETDLRGIYISKEDILKLKSDIDEMLEYNSQSTGEIL